MASTFLTDEWLEECNAALAGLGGFEGHSPIALTELVRGAAAPRHDAVTLLADAAGVRLVAGADPRATATLTISLDDAQALHDGSLDAAAVLARGGASLRGDLRALVEGLALLARAHERLRAR